MEQSKKPNGRIPITLTIFLMFLLAASSFVGLKEFANTEALKESHEVKLKTVKEAMISQTTADIKAFTANEIRNGLIRVMMDFQPKLDKQIAEKIVLHTLEESHRNGIDPILIAALIWVESRFDPFAKSNKGAIGLMQIRYKVWKKEPALLENGARKEGSLYWIDINIKSGIAIFTEYYEHADLDVVKTLYRYNTGSTKLPKGKRYYEIPYVSKVLISAYKIRNALTDR